MTTEQMDWLDDHYPNRHREDPKRPPIIEPWNASVTCDWGGCNRWTEAWRWHADGHPHGSGQWLPVCKKHSADYRPWWRLFGGKP